MARDQVCAPRIPRDLILDTVGFPKAPYLKRGQCNLLLKKEKVQKISLSKRKNLGSVSALGFPALLRFPLH